MLCCAVCLFVRVCHKQCFGGACYPRLSTVSSPPLFFVAFFVASHTCPVTSCPPLLILPLHALSTTQPYMFAGSMLAAIMCCVVCVGYGGVACALHASATPLLVA